MRGGSSRGQNVPFLKSPVHGIIHVSFSALRQEGGVSSGDIATMGDAVHHHYKSPGQVLDPENWAAHQWGFQFPIEKTNILRTQMVLT